MTTLTHAVVRHYGRESAENYFGLPAENNRWSSRSLPALPLVAPPRADFFFMASGHRGESPRPDKASSQQGRVPVQSGLGRPANCLPRRVVKKVRGNARYDVQSFSPYVGRSVPIAIKRTHSAGAMGACVLRTCANRHACIVSAVLFLLIFTHPSLPARPIRGDFRIDPDTPHFLCLFAT